MKTRKGNQSSFIVTLTMVLLIATMLMACSNAETTEETKKTEEAVVKEETAEVEVAEVKEAQPTPEPTAEPTPEPTPIVYEGIDMESTLPGREWVESFKGIIEEPKFVVFNDTTNKKVIVENEQEVKFEEGDTLAIFMPTGNLPGNYNGHNIKGLHTYNLYCCEVVFEEGIQITKDTISVDIFDENYVMSQIACTITP
jgi:hypothetical protein